MLTLVTISVVIPGSVLAKGAISDVSTLTTLIGQGMNTWVGSPNNSFSSTWTLCTGNVISIFAGTVTLGTVKISPRPSTPPFEINVAALTGSLVGLAAAVALYGTHLALKRWKGRAAAVQKLVKFLTPKPPPAEPVWSGTEWPDSIYADEAGGAAPQISLYAIGDANDDQVTVIPLDDDDHDGGSGADDYSVDAAPDDIADRRRLSLRPPTPAGGVSVISDVHAMSSSVVMRPRPRAQSVASNKKSQSHRTPSPSASTRSPNVSTAKKRPFR